ncbi:hypothetical protein HELRODRAFT_179150 [Helobdella robusta]|uniref:Uncharacterized protein n=1 Tax=Helobdella robusta TaxID=6412 RepID=T1FE93_HELRO|nr:hypothetical protein HELRODRAFT_179150 [Helobdella robusta]ESN95679.1 hypothetical protein HELRODRAFT_179150 [Helobdella robusta]
MEFLPICIEVLGPMDPNTLKFLMEICKMISVRSGDSREQFFATNHISCLLQRCTFNPRATSSSSSSSKSSSSSSCSESDFKMVFTERGICYHMETRDLYYSLIYPHLIYCNIIWGNSPEVHLKQITRCQNRLVS